MLRQKIKFGFLTDDQVLTVSRDGLAKSGLVVANVTARAVDPVAGALAGIVVRLDGAEPHDKTPVDDPATNPLSSGVPDFDFYSMEVVQRLGYDSYCPDNGVLLAKNKDGERTTGGPNAFRVFNWVIDAHPEDIKKLDFKRPNGEPVMRTIADYRQLNDALFHAGTNSGSQYEWEDAANRLHFYVINLATDARGVRTYTLGVRSLDGAGPQTRGAAMTAPSGALRVAAGQSAAASFTLKNTGKAAAIPADAQKQDVTTFAGGDIYRVSVSVKGDGWTASLPNALASVAFGASQPVPVVVARANKSASQATITVTAVSESDPSKRAVVTYTAR